jgi:hypothetical protein
MSRKYSNTAIQTTLSSSCSAAATTIAVTATTGFPAVDFVLALDAEGATQELVLVTAVAGTNLTVTRGYDNTTAVSHDAGAVVVHSHAAIDFKESRDHEAATAAHGATGAVVGTTNVQALTNKDLSSGTNTFPSTLATDVEVTAAVAAHEADTSVHGVATVAGLTEAQTLTNKTLASPVITGVGEVRSVVKAANESVASSTTLQDDNELLFTVAAGAKYHFSGTLFTVPSPGSIKLALNGPTLTALKFGLVSSGTGFVTAYGSTMNSADTCAVVSGTIECSDAGTVNLQWAQNTGDASAAQILAGSFIQVRRYA